MRSLETTGRSFDPRHFRKRDSHQRASAVIHWMTVADEAKEEVSNHLRVSISETDISYSVRELDQFLPTSSRISPCQRRSEYGASRPRGSYRPDVPASGLRRLEHGCTSSGETTPQGSIYGTFSPHDLTQVGHSGRSVAFREVAAVPFTRTGTPRSG